MLLWHNSPTPFLLAIEGLLRGQNGWAEAGVPGATGRWPRLIPADLLEAASRMADALAQTTSCQPAFDWIGPFRMQGHDLGPYGRIICVFPRDDERARYRSMARVVNHLTSGRLRLVSRAAFGRFMPRHPPVLAGPATSPAQVAERRQVFRDAIAAVLAGRRALLVELAFIELAANTALHGRDGSISAFLGGGKLDIYSEDRGPGFSLRLLLPSLLVKGCSTRPGSLGAGYPIVVDVADRVVLSTDERGTRTLVQFALSAGREGEE